MINTPGLPVYIDPARIFGWVEGRPFNTLASLPIGFRYPKNQARYDAVMGTAPDHQDFGADTDMTKRSAQAAQEILTDACDVMESLQTTKAMDEPIVVYELGDRLILLHGALRLSCVSLIRQTDPGLFKEVPAIFFEGPPQDAKRAMVFYQMETTLKTRPLTFAEQVAAVSYMVDQGIEKEKITRYMRWSKFPWYVDAMVHIFKTMTPEQLDAIDDEIRAERDAETIKTASDKTVFRKHMEAARDVIAPTAARQAKVKKATRQGDSFVRKTDGIGKQFKKFNTSLAAFRDHKDGLLLIESFQNITSCFNDLRALAIQEGIN